MASLTPGVDIDHRGTPFTQPLLDELLNALRLPTSGRVNIRDAQFEGALFREKADFGRAQFNGHTQFGMAQFSGSVDFSLTEFTDQAGFVGAQFSGDTHSFSGAQFSSGARFDMAEFNGHGLFHQARFSNDAGFNGARFSGEAQSFHGAMFGGEAQFVSAQFSGEAHFDEAQFSGEAAFVNARFSGLARFGAALFNGGARFDGAEFGNDAVFTGAEFSSHAWFDGARFNRHAWFAGVEFTGQTRFHGAQISGSASFSGAQFAVMSWFGPVACGQEVELSRAVFEVPVTLEIAAREVRCVRTQWNSTATVRLRYATADLSHAVLSDPVAVNAQPACFISDGISVDETLLAGPAGVRVASIQGVDAAHLVLTDTDLANCLFTGAFHLDQLRLEGRCTFAPIPTGWHRHGIWPVRWTRRRTLAEEHHWRALTAGQPASAPGQNPSSRAWHTGPHHPDPAQTPDPEDVAALYRQLRKAFEDGKNEPGAADFYYGECEMRRHDRTGTPPGERRLLWGYWLLSGYGLRASRAIGWLVAAMSLTVLLLMGFGLPTHDPDPATTGSLHGSKISLTTKAPDPALNGDWDHRMTWARAEKATRVAVNSVIFRSSGQNLTTWGTYIEMASRLLEPTLLALAVLAVRGRIKR